MAFRRRGAKGGPTPQGRQRKRKKKTSSIAAFKARAALKPSEWYRLLTESPTRHPRIVGIDMSLSNPAVTVLSLQTRSIHMYFFRNRQKEPTNAMLRINSPSSPFHMWLWQATCLEPASFPEPTVRFDAYLDKVQQILSVLGPASGPTVVGIEHYSLRSQIHGYSTQADMKLKELGGVLRTLLHAHGYTVKELPPSTIKKMFADKGHASKDDMYNALHSRFQLPDLCALLSLDRTTYTHVPHPVEDMVDSLATALTVLAFS